MLKPYVLAALLASTACAQAANSVSFAIDGANVQISFPKDCTDISCVSIHATKTPTIDDSEDVAPAPASPDHLDRSPADRSSVEAAPKPAPVTAPSTVPPANTPPTETAAVSPAPVVPLSARVPAVDAPATPSPVGLWLTEKKEGQVHIVPCGPNLCGYVYDAKTQRDGKLVLIDMKPTQTAQWSGKIRDVRGSGGIYDSTMSFNGDRLRIRGCAFGGMICGGQTWSRV